MFGDLARHYIKYELGELTEADDQKSHTTIERYLQVLKQSPDSSLGKSSRAGD